MLDQNQNEKPVRIKIANLYMHKTKKDGTSFLSGKLGWGTQLQIWPNRKRPGPEGEKDADYQVFLCQVDEKKKEGGMPMGNDFLSGVAVNKEVTDINDFPQNPEVPF